MNRGRRLTGIADAVSAVVVVAVVAGAAGAAGVVPARSIGTIFCRLLETTTNNSPPSFRPTPIHFSTRLRRRYYVHSSYLANIAVGFCQLVSFS